MDDNRDKEQTRNQMIAVVLMVVLFVVWFQWLAPTPQPKKPTATPSPAATQPQEQPPKPPEQEKPAAPQEPVAPWPGLPPVPQITEPEAEEVTIADEHLELVFTRIGARLKRASILLPTNPVQLVPTDTLPDTDAVYPLGLRFTDAGLGDALDRRRFDVEKDPAGRAVTFSLTLPGKAVVHKRFSLEDRRYCLRAEVDYQNLETQPQVLGMDQTPAYYLNWGPNVHSGDENMGLKQSLEWYKDSLLEELPTAKLAPAANGAPFVKTVSGADWMATKSAYFVVAIRPDFNGSQMWATGDPKRFRFGVGVPRFEAPASEVHADVFDLYMGPSEQRSLAAAWAGLSKVLRFFSPPWGFMDAFAKALLWLLNLFYAIIPNYGLAIIFLTIVVRGVMIPLTLKSMKSMKKMQLLGPEIEELKQKYPDNPQEMNKKMMELYKERGVNPLGGCLPMLLQMPVFIALYRMLWCAFELRGAPFMFWMSDLSQADRLVALPWMQQVPFLGATFHSLNVLPILMGVAMLLNQKFMPVSGPAQNPQQKMMMNIMPVFFSFICYNMASGLNLYILTSTVLGMVQQKFIRVTDMELKAKKTVGKRQHFYTAAQARKRQLNREVKLEKRRKLEHPDSPDAKGK